MSKLGVLLIGGSVLGGLYFLGWFITKYGVFDFVVAIFIFLSLLALILTSLAFLSRGVNHG